MIDEQGMASCEPGMRYNKVWESRPRELQRGRGTARTYYDQHGIRRIILSSGTSPYSNDEHE